MKKYEYCDPEELREDGGYRFSAPAPMAETVAEPDAAALWETVMRRVSDADGRIVLRAPDTVSQSLSRQIERILDDERHIYDKFFGKRPTMTQIYRAAGFSRSKWNRIRSGALSDLDRGSVFALAVALRLDEEQTAALLYSAGLALNYELDLDAAMMYFIKRGIYDLEHINAVLGCFSDVRNGLDCFFFQPPARGK